MIKNEMEGMGIEIDVGRGDGNETYVISITFEDECS